MKLTNRELLAQLMESQGWTVRSLADACDLQSHGMIQELKTGAKTSCSLRLALAIAEALKVAPGVLFEIRTSNHSGQNVPAAS